MPANTRFPPTWSSSCLAATCASVDEEEIAEGLKIVEQQLKDRTVRTGEEELFKARARGERIGSDNRYRKDPA